MRFRLLLSLWFLGTYLPSPAAITTNVTYGSFFFVPRVVSINAGDTVVWTNGFGSHTVLGTGSDPICGGAFLPCSHTFSTPGTYFYECTVVGHAAQGMTGVVNVASAPLTPAVLTNAMRLANGLISLGFRLSPWRPHSRLLSPMFFASGAKRSE